MKHNSGYEVHNYFSILSKEMCEWFICLACRLYVHVSILLCWTPNQHFIELEVAVVLHIS